MGAAAPPSPAGAGVAAVKSPSPASIDIGPLARAVQTNCHIADARHAADLTLCIYLLQMREFYRWEQGLPLDAPLRHQDVGAWLDAREALWDGLAEAPYAPLPLADGEPPLDAFDAAAVNARLVPQGWVYGAGRIAGGRPVFFLGELHDARRRDGLDVLTGARELARGLAAPPAALSGRTVLLRRESLLRWLWEKFETWGLKQRDGAFRSALAAYGWPGEGDAAPALHAMADEQMETLLLHEIGEYRAGEQLGAAAWSELRTAVAAAGDARADALLRAVRDHLADCLVTLPTLLERDAAASIHFWFANFEGLRAELFPSLFAAYRAWCSGAGRTPLDAALADGAAHWLAIGERALALQRERGPDAAAELSAWLMSEAVRR